MKKHSVGKVLLLEIAVILIVFLLETVASGGKAAIQYFLDLPSVFCILLFIVPALWVSGTMKDFVAAFSVGKKPYTLTQMKRALEAVKMAQKLTLCAMGFSVVIVFVVLLYRMEDPQILGPSFAVMVLTVFYGIIVEFLLIPVSAHVQNHITEAMDVPEEEEFANAKIVMDSDDEED